jgi:nitrite reductase/ring-hydroxylating ferredoxin subunit
MHGALFKIEDGHCLSGPCFDQNLESIEIKEDNGVLFAIMPPKPKES